MKQVAQAEGFVLVLTQLSDAVRRQMEAEVLASEGPEVCQVFPDLDHGVEWCEEQVLRKAMVIAGEEVVGAEDLEGPAEGILELVAMLSGPESVSPAAAAPASVEDTGLGPYLERMDVPTDHCLIRQGDAPQGLYLVERGVVTASLEREDGQLLRLRKMGPGSIVGEMGLYLGSAATATVMAREPTTIYYLSADALQRMEAEAPEVAEVLHRYLVQVLGERLARANVTIQAMLGPEGSWGDPEAQGEN
jgi:SulP family sulfate permease